MPTDVQGKVEELMQGKPDNSAVNVITTTEEQYAKIKESNDKLEAELKRQEQLRSAQLTTQMMGGKSLGIVQEKTKEEKARDDAAEILKTYGYGK